MMFQFHRLPLEQFYNNFIHQSITAITMLVPLWTTRYMQAIWWVLSQKQVSRAGTSNYLSLPLTSASGTMLLNWEAVNLPLSSCSSCFRSPLCPFPTNYASVSRLSASMTSASTQMTYPSLIIWSACFQLLASLTTQECPYYSQKMVSMYYHWGQFVA